MHFHKQLTSIVSQVIAHHRTSKPISGLQLCFTDKENVYLDFPNCDCPTQPGEKLLAMLEKHLPDEMPNGVWVDIGEVYGTLKPESYVLIGVNP